MVSKVRIPVKESHLHSEFMHLGGGLGLAGQEGRKNWCKAALRLLNGTLMVKS